PAADVLMRLPWRPTDRRPADSWLGDGLVGARFILTPHREAGGLGQAVGLVDGPLFSSVFGSTTRTTPAFRLRCAVPAGHQVRVRCYELPASRKIRRIVVAPTGCRPSSRSASQPPARRPGSPAPARPPAAPSPAVPDPAARCSPS